MNVSSLGSSRRVGHKKSAGDAEFESVICSTDMTTTTIGSIAVVAAAVAASV